MANTSAELSKARADKKDEFYTSYEDIAKEIPYYGDYFANKIVYTNCDNPNQSMFWQYFYDNFHSLQLKELISTYYDVNNTVYKTVYNGSVIVKTVLQDGSFDSEECINILQAVDVVVTNPPFSLTTSRFIPMLVKYNKDFLFLSNMNALTSKNVFPLIKNKQLWFGASIHSGDREFRVPDDYPITAVGYRIDENGVKYVRVKGIRWFTNINYANRFQDLQLTCTYNSTDYPFYDNCSDVINVDKTCDIPKDYFGIMGVPISWFDKYNPQQFEILGLDKEFTTDKKRGIINGKQKYARIFIRRCDSDLHNR